MPTTSVPPTTRREAYKAKAESQYQTLPERLSETVGGLMPHVPSLLPADIELEQFRAALYLELTGLPTLAECTAASLRDAVLKAALYGLLPGRDCHILPFRSGKGAARMATFVPNYFGLILALERTGKVAKAFAHPVYTGDEFVVDYLADLYRHVPAVTLGRQPGSLRFFYGCVRMKDGTVHLEVMDEPQIDAVRRRAPAHEHGPWVEDYLMMARKTVLKRVMKYVRLTPQMQQLLEDEDERQRQDISQTRHEQNIRDLYGDAAVEVPPRIDAPQTAQDAPQATNASPGVPPDATSPDAPTEAPQPSLWEQEEAAERQRQEGQSEIYGNGA